MTRTTLKALSEHLGLSEGTVSRALSGYPDISERTKERVMTAAKELGYQPNSSARRLAKGRAECIGYILPARTGYLSDPFLAQLLDGITQALHDRHWDLMMSVPRTAADELDAITRLARSGRVDGLIISRTLVEDVRVKRMQELKIPFVTHGLTAQSAHHAWYDVDNARATQDAVRFLHELGHRKIGHIHAPLRYNFANLRREGYVAGLEAAGLPYSPRIEAEAELSSEAGHKACTDLLSLDAAERPTALVCVSDMVAIGAMQAIRDMGLTPGADVSVVGYDGLPIGEHTSPPLTTMAQPLIEGGRRIGEMLLAVIDGADPHSQQELATATLIRRDSAMPPKTL
jgi:LacI family transcriptional regulator